MGGIGDLIVWREASDLEDAVGAAAERLVGPGAKVIAEQIVRAANSIQANIAEGYGRGLSQARINFFAISKSSADELEAHLRGCGRRCRLPQDLVDGLVGHTRRVGYLLYRFQQSDERRLREVELQTQVAKGRKGGGAKGRRARRSEGDEGGRRSGRD
jgi:four helix bundle protein